jgi:16S rRNA (uracil1498-N3)-methyltransferase
VAVFDGRGHEFLARIVVAARRDATLQLLSRVEPAPESPVHLTLVQAVLKGDKMDEVVRDAVMLGVSAVQPIVTKRAEATVAALVRGARVERWRRVALSSAKQCGRAVMPDIRLPLTFENFLDEPSTAVRLMLVEPHAAVELESFTALRGDPVPQDASLLVGPEGGWEESEWSAARSKGARLMSLGPRTLRADAVPIAAISVLQFLWDQA